MGCWAKLISDYYLNAYKSMIGEEFLLFNQIIYCQLRVQGTDKILFHAAYKTS
jgi:hypothetical protein